jgi:hypothetical protein
MRGWETPTLLCPLEGAKKETGAVSETLCSLE